jgi:CheY-like chemotaxis protein
MLSDFAHQGQPVRVRRMTRHGEGLKNAANWRARPLWRRACSRNRKRRFPRDASPKQGCSREVTMDSALTLATQPRDASLAGLRVLAVDDDADSGEGLAELLRFYGATVCTARSAYDGYDLLQSWRPKVLLSDLAMPDQDGYGFIKRVRALPGPLNQIIAIAVTGRTDAAERARAITSGFTSLVPKPVSIRALIGIMRVCIRQQAD